MEARALVEPERVLVISGHDQLVLDAIEALLDGLGHLHRGGLRPVDRLQPGPPGHHLFRHRSESGDRGVGVADRVTDVQQEP